MPGLPERREAGGFVSDLFLRILLAPFAHGEAGDALEVCLQIGRRSRIAALERDSVQRDAWVLEKRERLFKPCLSDGVED